jgi:hypothetical protein
MWSYPHCIKNDFFDEERAHTGALRIGCQFSNIERTFEGAWRAMAAEVNSARSNRMHLA